MEASPTACTQCGTQLIDKYCQHCGQLHSGKKASMSLLFRESLATFFSLERSGFASLFLLVTKPRLIILNYLEGNRGYYQPPNKLLFYALVVFGLHFSWVDSTVLNLSFDIEGVSPSLFFMAIVIPILSLAGWLLYNPRKHHFAEHLITNSYMVSVWYILLTLFGNLYDYIAERDWGTIDFFIFILVTPLYSAFVFRPQKHKIKQIGLAFLHFALFVLIIAALVALVYLLGGRVKNTTV